MGKTLETIKALEEFADEQIEQKKEAQRQLDDVKSDLEFRRDLFKLQEQQLNEVRAELREAITQRNNLAEALERILSYQGRFAEEEPESIAREALKSLEL
jgi:hypothetical protein